MLPIFRSMQRLIDGINRVMREQLSGIRVIRAFAREPFERNDSPRPTSAVSDTALAAGRWQALMLPVTTLVINISSVALIWFGGLRIDSGHMQVGSLIAFLSYFMQILMAVLMATCILVIVPRASVCAERITEVLSTEPAITSPAAPGVRPSAPSAARSACDDATFCYPGAERPVLEDVSLAAEPGTTTAIVGLYRVGQVDAGVVDLPAVRRHRRRRCGSTGSTSATTTPSSCGRRSVLVPQRGYLFSGTVAENLRYGKADATEDEMWDALRVAAADGFVRAHPDGLEMRVAQGGINFSGGQRQRLAIARAVIRRPAIYLFDDAFSALDVHTDARVRAALREVSADATVIIVSQRISTVAAGRPDRRHRRRPGGGRGDPRDAAGRLPHLRRVRRFAVDGRRRREAGRDRAAGMRGGDPRMARRTPPGAVARLQGLGAATWSGG